MQRLSPFKSFINVIRDVTCNEVLITLVNLCGKRVSACQGCNGPVKNNGLPFPPPYGLVVGTKMRREYFKDGRKQMSGPSKVYFHLFHENPFISPFECVQRRMMTFRMGTVNLHWDAFKSTSDVQKIHLQRLGLPIPLFQLILST